MMTKKCIVSSILYILKTNTWISLTMQIRHQTKRSCCSRLIDRRHGLSKRAVSPNSGKAHKTSTNKRFKMRKRNINVPGQENLVLKSENVVQKKADDMEKDRRLCLLANS